MIIDKRPPCHMFIEYLIVASPVPSIGYTQESLIQESLGSGSMQVVFSS